ncbi:hypothetical protein [Streptomyces sp. NPDC091027]|uniref:hypothetical protein n=1 Tax=Streptomyces sp. NPDC091027 TaxID=3365971 RepID=UPI0037F14918
MTTRVESGQIWADEDKRRTGRKLRIDEVKANFVFCTVLQNTYEVQEQIDTYGFGAAVDRRGTTTRIGLARFYDGDYRLCDPTDLQAMSVAQYGNLRRLPTACIDLASHRWVPVGLHHAAAVTGQLTRDKVVTAVCPKCWSHTAFDTVFVPTPLAPGDIAA